MHERRFHGGADRLRTPERVSLLEVDRVAGLSIDGDKIIKVLDVGTGSGLFAVKFAAMKKDVTGVDISDEMLEAARGNVPEAKFEKSLAESLPFADKSFDVVFMGLVLHETDDIAKALSEARRVAKKRVAILEWPYSAGEYGPPLEHRINPELLKTYIEKNNFKSFEIHELKNLVLYLLNP